MVEGLQCVDQDGVFKTEGWQNDWKTGHRVTSECYPSRRYAGHCQEEKVCRATWSERLYCSLCLPTCLVLISRIVKDTGQVSHLIRLTLRKLFYIKIRFLARNGTCSVGWLCLRSSRCHLRCDNEDIVFINSAPRVILCCLMVLKCSLI